jgi:hypothetical protein
MATPRWPTEGRQDLLFTNGVCVSTSVSETVTKIEAVEGCFKIVERPRVTQTIRVSQIIERPGLLEFAFDREWVILYCTVPSYRLFSYFRKIR